MWRLDSVLILECTGEELMLEVVHPCSLLLVHSVVLNLHQERSKSLDFDWGFQGDSTRAVPAALWRDLVCQNEAITFHILIASRTFFGLLNRLQWKCMHADAEMELFLPVLNVMFLIQSKLEGSWFRMKVLGFCLSTCLIQLSSRC